MAAMTYQSISIQFRGQIARAMAEVYQRRQQGQDVTGQLPCPRCRSSLSFTVFPSGMSRGRCAQAGCIH